MLNREIIEFCCKEVHYQRRGPMQVWGMLLAWEHAKDLLLDHENPTLEDIQRLAAMIEPGVNAPGSWRNCEVRIGNDFGAHVSDLPERLGRWSAFLEDMPAEAAYFQFEKIHPFADGNGRTGKIIFNWKNGTLDAPIFPKSFQEDKWHADTPAFLAHLKEPNS